MEHLFRSSFGSPVEANEARHGLHDALSAAGISAESIDLAAVMASELMANALTHADTVRPRLTADHHGSSVLVTVEDAGTRLPVVRPPSDRVGGNGMRIVAGYARTWGTVVHDGLGKTVWFTVAP